MFYLHHKIRRKIRQAYISRHNSERKHQVILPMIKDGEKWHYLAVKILSRLLRELHQQIMMNFMNCLHSFKKCLQENENDNACKNHDYCNVKMPKARNKILKFN